MPDPESLPSAQRDVTAACPRLETRASFELSREDMFHVLRHSGLTHAAEKGASTPVLMKLSGHTSVRGLAKYARVSDEGLLNSQADTDPAARRHRRRSGHCLWPERNMMSI
ncbi:tyrosine-type recombinase/integrase [Streptomyces sp. NPDC005322]|uniref:tyrosine-type recombinase/integrase n=1 Tax=Streptomyces sp. NPDC005322 TaxID=3157032 RepID=UPI0033BE3481